MSSIAFSTPSDEARVRGPERFMMGALCNDLMLAAFGPREHRDWLKPLLPPELGGWSPRNVEYWLRGGGRLLAGPEGVSDAWTLGLNTALTLGNDTVRLMARLHGQCEIHCWAEGKDRPWLAKMIRAGLRDRLLRDGMGWEAVAGLLEARTDEPVVCSYSVCESFPGPHMLPAGHPLRDAADDDGDAFYDLPPAEAWEACMQGLRESDDLLQIRPEDWHAFRFGNGLDAFSLRAEAHRRKAAA